MAKNCSGARSGASRNTRPRSKGQPAKAVRFADLQSLTQEELGLMAWNRVTRPEDLSGVFGLAGWRFPTGNQAKGQESLPDRTRVAWSEGAPASTAWCWKGEEEPKEADLRKLSPGDPLVMAAPDGRIRVLLRTEERWAGLREVPLATRHRPTSRLAIEFVVAALEGSSRLSLAQFLDAEGATARFFNDVRALIKNVARKVDGSERRREAVVQRLLGRLLSLRFVEEKGWLPRDFLRSGWKERKGLYYSGLLRGVFSALDTPPESRQEKAEEIPYLNGGLFAERADEKALELPDELFDPEGAPPTILGVLYSYQSTLDQKAGRVQQVSVAPAMLGRVPSWMGRPTGLSLTLCQQMKRTLASEKKEGWLTQSAAQELESLRTEYAGLVGEGEAPLESTADGLVWHTFAGAAINRLLAAALESLGAGKWSAGNLSLKQREAGTAAAARSAIEALRGLDLAATAMAAAEESPFAELSKFQVCLPERLDRKLVAERVFDVEGARALLRDFQVPVAR